MKLFCKLGLHWRMKVGHCLFIDSVSSKEVFSAICPCGIEWMIEDIFGFPLFKVRRGTIGEKKMKITAHVVAEACCFDLDGLIEKIWILRKDRMWISQPQPILDQRVDISGHMVPLSIKDIEPPEDANHLLICSNIYTRDVGMIAYKEKI